MRSLRVAFLLLVAGCSACEEEPEPQETADQTGDESPVAVERGEARVGRVTGRVVLAPGFSLPSFTAEQVTPAQATSPLPEECEPIGEDDRFPVSLGEGRGLEGMMVAATADDADAFTEALGETEPAEHVVTITDCRLSPRLITATKGDRLVVRNETDHPFLPRLGPSSFMQGIQRGESVDFTLERGGVNALQCGFGSPCGRAEVVVLYRPVHTVSGDGGEFTLDEVPAGMPVTIRAWHPVYGQVDAHLSVELEEGGSESIELVITPPDSEAASASDTESDSDSDTESDSDSDTESDSDSDSDSESESASESDAD